MIGEHMALFLDKGTIRPGIADDKKKYSARSLNKKVCGNRDKATGEDPNYTSLHRQQQLDTFEDNSEALYGEIARIYRGNVGGTRRV